MAGSGLANSSARLFSNPAGDYGSMVNERVGAGEGPLNDCALVRAGRMLGLTLQSNGAACALVLDAQPRLLHPPACGAPYSI